MKQLRLCLGVLLSFFMFMPAQAAFAGDITSPPSLIISEIKVKNDTSTSGYNEFIELYNADVTSLNLNNFTIEYFNSPAPADSDQPLKKVIIADGLLLPAQTLLLAANKAQMPNALDSPFSSLSDTGGTVRVRALDGTIQEQVAWTSTSVLAISPVLFLSSSTANRTQSFTRSLDSQGNVVLANPVWQLITPTPHADVLLAVPQPDPEPEAVPPLTTTDTPSEVQIETGPSDPVVAIPAAADPALPLQISELLPNPAPPASDSTGEYIELYNPNIMAVDLGGYRLQSGNTYSYNYTFSDGTLQPREYRAFYVSETGDLLANSGGKARLLDPSGQVISETSPYDTADDGLAWVFVNGSWQWTTTPTPNAENLLSLPAAVKPAVKSAATAKAAAKPKATAAKATKTTSSKASAKPKTAKPANASSAGSSSPVVSSIHPGIIAGVGAAALIYALWEYRYDMANRFYQLKRYRTSRRAARQSA